VAATLKDGYNNMDVWVVPTWDMDENGEKAPAPCNISRNWKWDGSPAWSPDGRVIAFSGDRTATGFDCTDDDRVADSNEVVVADLESDRLHVRVARYLVNGYPVYRCGDDVNRVVLDVTTKPPASVEYE
jgi:Tol biopolymer transport system component